MAGTTRSRLNDLLAPDIIAHTRIVQKGEAATREYFHAESKLFRAIQTHISDPNAECVIINRPNNPVMCYRGTGSAIHFKGLTVYGTQYKFVDAQVRNVAYEVDYFSLTIEVEYEDDYNDNFTRQYTLNVPIDLEVNFTQEKFDAWLTELAQKKKLEGEIKDRDAFNALLKKHPQWGNPSGTP